MNVAQKVEVDPRSECRFWGSMQHDEKSGEYVAPCLINPPVFVFGVDHGCWPVTNMYDRCGHWRAVRAVSPSAMEAPADGWPEGHTGEPSCLCTACIPF